MTKRKPKAGFKSVEPMPDDGRKARGYWLNLIGATSWDEVLDGGTYEICIPQAKGTDMLDKFLDTARTAVKRRTVSSGRRLSLRTERQNDTTVKLQLVDHGPL